MRTPPFLRPIRLLRSRRGMVALEFALLAPVLVLMMLGFYEAYMYLRTVAMMERAVGSVANIMSRQTVQLRDCADSNDATNLGTYVVAIQNVLGTLPLQTHGMVFLSAVQNPGGSPRVMWQRRSQYKLDGEISRLGTQGSNANLPEGLGAAVTAANGAIVLVAEVSYRFSPFAFIAPLWPDNPGQVTIRRAAYFRARTFNNSALMSTQQAGCGTALPTPPG